MQRGLAIRALKIANYLRSRTPNCICHSDRCSQYCSYDFQKNLCEQGFKTSMSGKGNRHDNADVEPFPKAIEAQLIWCLSWETRRQAKTATFQ